jgi:uncharacterized protein (DUF779 family)
VSAPKSQGGPPKRALITAAAAELLATLQRRNGALMFHQSGGCCDGSSPMCYPAGEFVVGDRDILLAILDVGDGVPVWISGPQFEAWKHTQLVIDVVPGRGGGFSVEAPEGMRFLSRGRAFTDAENRLLSKQRPVTGEEFSRGVRPPVSDTHIVAEGVEVCPMPTGRGSKT